MGDDRHVLREEAKCSRPLPADYRTHFRTPSRDTRLFYARDCDAVPPVSLLDADVAIGFNVECVECAHFDVIIGRSDAP